MVSNNNPPDPHEAHYDRKLARADEAAGLWFQFAVLAIAACLPIAIWALLLK